MRAIELIITIVVGFNAIASLAALTIRRARRRQALTHDEYQAQLRADNEELDRQLDEIRRGQR